MSEPFALDRPVARTRISVDADRVELPPEGKGHETHTFRPVSGLLTRQGPDPAAEDQPVPSHFTSTPLVDAPFLETPTGRLGPHSSMAEQVDGIASYLVATEKLESDLGREFVRDETIWAFKSPVTVFNVPLRQYVTSTSGEASATTADVIGPVREVLRELRDRRHLLWLNQQRVAFEVELTRLRIDVRGESLRGHRDVTDPHYAAMDAQLGMGGMLWRFTSNPQTEVVSIADGVDFAKVVRLVAGHTGGNKKDDGSVRTLSFGRNLAALIGVAHSNGGDANVAGINARAEYLYGVSLDSLQGQGITAHPAEARMIGIFETEYVLLASPGAPPRRLEDLATIKYRNPFKTADGGQIPDLPRKAIGQPSAEARKIDPPSADLTDPPDGFRSAVIAYALKVASAANNQSGTVQDKEGHLGAKVIDRAVSTFIKDINSYNPNANPLRATGPSLLLSRPLGAGRVSRSSRTTAIKTVSPIPLGRPTPTPITTRASQRTRATKSSSDKPADNDPTKSSD